MIHVNDIAGGLIGASSSRKWGAHVLYLHHVGWLVRSLNSSIDRLVTASGFATIGIDDTPWGRVGFLDAGCSMIELLEASDVTSELGKLVSNGFEGIHHLAYAVPDVSKALKEAASRGALVLDAVPRDGARGTHIGFVDPGLPGGVLLEFVQDSSAHLCEHLPGTPS